ncbi:MAG: hypothetical protein D6681_10125 [Calditrichaeota bacterium]|nr:MAG: hypothetical protein D6681_10125 [Calditrichota bacterium]
MMAPPAFMGDRKKQKEQMKNHLLFRSCSMLLACQAGDDGVSGKRLRDPPVDSKFPEQLWASISSWQPPCAI